MSSSLLFALLVAGGCLLSSAQTKSASEPQGPAQGDESIYVPVHKFDPKRDAAADIQAAIAEAQKTGQRILVDVGGDWCQYCREMDEFFKRHADLAQLRDASFITVDVFYSSENKNEKFLSRYPKVEGIPHFFVLEKDGALLRSQHVLELRSGGAYDPGKMKDFLTKWSPRPVVNATTN